MQTINSDDIFKEHFYSIFHVDIFIDLQGAGLIIKKTKTKGIWKFVKNAHTNKKNPFSQILLGEKNLAVPELGNIPSNFKTILSNLLVLDSSCAQRVAQTRVQ